MSKLTDIGRPRLTEADRSAHLDFAAAPDENAMSADPGDKTEDIAARFPGPATLFADRRKQWRLVRIFGVYTAVFIGAVVYLAFHPAPDSTMLTVWIGFFLAISGLGVLSGVIKLATNASCVCLDASGFTICHPWHRDRRYSWSDVSGFKPLYYPRFKYSTVVFKTIKPRPGILVKINTLLAGGKNDWLLDDYGYEAGYLAWSMSKWQRLALAGNNLANPH